MKAPCIIIGGGLSGLAAAIRLSRYTPEVLLLERHHRLGGLNSYYRRNGMLLETGLHAVTNFAPPEERNAPLNKLFRQLKLSRKRFQLHEQMRSEIRFPKAEKNLLFTNDFRILKEEIAAKFPHCRKGFEGLLKQLAEYDPFRPAPFRSARKFLLAHLGDSLLVEMLLCPLMYYGSSIENDIDLSQFVIMFRSIFEEGMFRPAGTMADFLAMLRTHLENLGGTIRTQSGVARIVHENGRAHGVELESGETIACDFLLSTVGLSETYALLGQRDPHAEAARIGFVESIFLLPHEKTSKTTSEKTSAPAEGRTVIFYNLAAEFRYARPDSSVDYASGVICFPDNFEGRPARSHVEIRTTHLADYASWQAFGRDSEIYARNKRESSERSLAVVRDLLGHLPADVVYRDTFTPLTINRFTGKKHGAIYGCPSKIKDGNIGFDNLFLAGTDQGFLGIVGSMLSGVTMVNQHLLPRL